MKALTLIRENHSGLLAEVTTLLEQRGVHLHDFSGQVFGDTAVISLTVEDYKEAFRLLSDSGYRVVTSDHLLVRLEKHSGALAELSRRLAQARVDVRGMHIINRDAKAGIVALETTDYELAQSVLSDILVLDL
jgi:hypothetical protein